MKNENDEIHYVDTDSLMLIASTRGRNVDSFSLTSYEICQIGLSVLPE